MKQIHFKKLNSDYTHHHLYDIGWLPWDFQRFVQKRHIRMERVRTFSNFCKQLGYINTMILYAFTINSIANGLMADRMNVQMLLCYAFAGLAINHLRFEYRWFLRFTNQ